MRCDDIYVHYIRQTELIVTTDEVRPFTCYIIGILVKVHYSMTSCDVPYWKHIGYIVSTFGLYRLNIHLGNDQE